MSFLKKLLLTLSLLLVINTPSIFAIDWGAIIQTACEIHAGCTSEDIHISVRFQDQHGNQVDGTGEQWTISKKEGSGVTPAEDMVCTTNGCHSTDLGQNPWYTYTYYLTDQNDPASGTTTIISQPDGDMDNVREEEVIIERPIGGDGCPLGHDIYPRSGDGGNCKPNYQANASSHE